MLKYYTRRRFLSTLSGALVLLGLGSRAQGKPWPQGFVLDVSVAYEGGGFRYRNPYLAVFVEDESGRLVRTLGLFLMGGKGQRWWPDLRRYYAQGADMATLAGPTRPPGRYAFRWDGKDEKGRPVGQGTYYLVVEYAREHGPYELFREALSLGEAPFKKTFARDGEVKEVAVDYHKA